MPEYGAVNSKSERTPTRIDHDIERVKTFTTRINSTTTRIVQHAHALGYFNQPDTPGTSSNGAVAPVVTTLADALQELEHAIDRNSGSLNLFD